MKIAIFTLTRDRLEFTKHCFKTFEDNAGHAYDHYIVDNGSQDGTVEWLKENESKFKNVIYNPENVGISKASNQALEAIFSTYNETHNIKYDLVIKVDNDAEVLSENILGQIVEIYESLGEFNGKYILSPRIEGINSQPTRARYESLAGRRTGIVGIVGGIFHVVPASVYSKYRYSDDLPKAHGQDDTFCDWARNNGCTLGYIEGLVVNHYLTTDGQCKHNRAYFERKWQEEKL